MSWARAQEQVLKMSQIVELAVTQHQVFGALATFKVGAQPLRRFTKEEASILSLALVALARGISQERQIFMSPIASDLDFEASAQADGVAIHADGFADVFLDWSETQALADALSSFSP
jgi:hypothetical protein